jgi:uncharacterized GH25 family protein
MRSPVRRALCGVVVVITSVATAHAAQAHDFWIEPSLFTAKPGELINVHLHVGHAFEGEPVRRQSQRIEKFIAAGPDGEKDLPGVEGGDPAGFLRPKQPGVYVLGYRSNHARSELEAEKFESYLREEGLERISSMRSQRGDSSQPGREIYSRCAKSIVLVGDGAPPDVCDRALGFRLEFIPPADLVTRPPVGDVTFQLLFEGKPIEGVLVRASSRREPHRELKSRTDKDGRVSFALDYDGAWLLHAVHMIEATATPDAEADWESLWASLTFALPAAASP